MKKRIRVCIGIMIFGLAISGITAFPLETELAWLVKHSDLFQSWFYTVYEAISYVNVRYPFLSYGTDWLAFAHIMLAILFIGPFRDPVKNKWVIEFGMIACIAIIPLAFIAGSIRQIPVFWRLIDCSFGVFGIIPLIICYYDIKKLAS
jgi:hypothetical protein